MSEINFKKLIGITINSGGGTMCKELLDYFDFDVNTPSVSAYTQQCSKVLPEVFEFLFNSFTQENMPSTNNYKGYRLIACDGSNLTIAANPNDAEVAYNSNQFGTITNHLHLNAFYDVLNRIYLDAVLQTASECQECRACINMMERSSLNEAILIADRGYENYNLMAHAINKGWKFVIRIRDKNSNGIASGLKRGMLQMSQYYEPEFKEKIVRLHLEEGRTLKGLAKEYGVYPENKILTYHTYQLRKETIERIFGTAKEQYGFRYTQYLGKVRMEMKAGLTFAYMNLKKLAKILEHRDKIEARISGIFRNEAKYWLYNEKWDV